MGGEAEEVSTIIMIRIKSKQKPSHMEVSMMHRMLWRLYEDMCLEPEKLRAEEVSDDSF